MNKKNKTILLLIVLAIAAVVVPLGVMFQNHNTGQDSDMITVQLQPNANETEEDLEEDLELISKRLDYIIGKNRYSFKREKDRLLLSFSEEELKGLRVSEFLEFFILEPGRMSIAEENSGYLFHSIAYPEQEDILSVEIKQDYQQKILNGKSEQQTEAGEDVISDQSYLEIRFSSEIATTLKQYLNSSDAGELYLINNMIYDDYETNEITSSGYQIYPNKEDFSVWYLPYSPDDNLTGFEDAFIYNLTHEYLHQPFNYYIREKEEWQDIAECDYPGNLQCNAENFTEDFYTIQYSYNTKRMTKDESSYLERFMKSKLDIIGEKYAFGQNGKGVFFIKMPASGINKQLLGTIGDSGTLSLEYGNKKWNLSNHDIAVYHSEAQNLTVFLESPDTIRENTKEYGKNLFLYLEDLPIAVLYVDEPILSDEITFRQFCFDDKKEITDENSWFLDYLSLILESKRDNTDKYNNLGLELEDYCYNDKEYSNDSHFGLKPSYIYDLFYNIKKEEKIIHEICPEATIDTDIETKRIEINLKHPFNDELISDSMKDIRQIYEAIDFENSPYESIWFYPFDPEKDERAWIIFSKNTLWAEGAKIYFDGYFGNGRVEHYFDDLRKFASEDTFFKNYITSSEKTMPGSGWHIY